MARTNDVQVLLLECTVDSGCDSVVMLPTRDMEKSIPQEQDSEIPALIQRQVYENLFRLQDRRNASAIGVQFPSSGRSEREPHSYQIQQRNPEEGQKSTKHVSRELQFKVFFRLSKIATLGDASCGWARVILAVNIETLRGQVIVGEKRNDVELGMGGIENMSLMACCCK